VDDDILTKQYFPRTHTEARRELKTGFSVVRAKGERERDQQKTGPWKSSQDGLQSKQKDQPSPKKYMIQEGNRRIRRQIM
jgi:hypothetical protein